MNGGTGVISSATDTTVSVPINIAGSDSLNGFDIQVFADPTLLNGASVSLTGSVLASPRVVLECINGILVAGSTCAPQDANGVVHFSVAQLGSPVSGTGVLFSINYNIVGHTPTTPISFNMGCSGTSVSGVCVTIANAGVALSETAQGSTFSNLNDFSMIPAFTSLSTPAGVAILDTISYTALGAFSDTLNEIVTGPCTLATGSVNLAFGPTGSDTLSCSSATNGDFTSTVTATGASSGTSHSITVKLHVAPTGFASTLNQPSIQIGAGSSDSTTVITLQGVSGFSGTVAITATGPTGITGSPSPSSVTLTADASGYSTATSTLTVTVGSAVAPGTYALAITGGSSLSVIVQAKDFSITASPTVESVPRGGSAAATLNLCSLGNFAGTVTFSASIATSNLDAGSGTGTVSTSFLPASVTLTAGGCASTAFAAGSVKIGLTPNPANTATGNYVVTITATSGSSPHTATVAFNVFDFVIGPTYCPGNTPIYTTPDTWFDPGLVGEACNTFTLTTQTVAQGGKQAVLWAQVNVLGGMTTFGASGYGIQGGDPTGPGRGFPVPGLGNRCMFQTYFANGTQISRAYLAANGPIVIAAPGSGCRGFGEAWPGDFEAPACIPPDNPSLLDCAAPNNPDFFKVTAQSLANTKPGTYFVDICGLDGSLINCQRVTLIVVQAPIVSQFNWTHQGSISASHGGHFQLRVLNTDQTNTILATVTIVGTGSFGDKFKLSLGPIAIAPNTDSPFNLFQTFTSSEVGETFVFTSSIAVSATDAGALTGTSTLQSVSSTFTVVP